MPVLHSVIVYISIFYRGIVYYSNYASSYWYDISLHELTPGISGENTRSRPVLSCTICGRQLLGLPSLGGDETCLGTVVQPKGGGTRPRMRENHGLHRALRNANNDMAFVRTTGMDDQSEVGSPRTLKTVARAIDIIQTLEELGGAGITELADALGLLKSYT